MIYTVRRCYGPYRQTVPQRPQPSGSPSLGLSVRGFRGVRAPRSGYRRCDPLAASRVVGGFLRVDEEHRRDRKSTRLNSSHGYISYAVFCLKKKKNNTTSTFTLSA